MTSVYLASRFARGGDLEAYAAEARAAGLTVTSRWHNGSHGDPVVDSDVTDPAMPGYAADDMADLAAADAVVSFTEGGGGKGGRHVEFGLGLALHKRMVIVGPREHVFHTAQGVEQVDTWPVALDLLCSTDGPQLLGGIRPPCGEPTGMAAPGHQDWACQRGNGHPGVHEVMIGTGSRMAWGSHDAMRADRIANGDSFPDDDEDDDDLDGEAVG